MPPLEGVELGHGERARFDTGLSTLPLPRFLQHNREFYHICYDKSSGKSEADFRGAIWIENLGRIWLSAVQTGIGLDRLSVY
jgi:hypothetical protein